MAFNSKTVRDSYESLKMSDEAVAARFYTLLFETYPEMKRLLPTFAAGNLERATATAFTLTLKYLDDPDELSRELSPYARRLRQNGLRNVHFAALGETWLRTLASLHRDKWTGSLSRQWSIAFQRAALALRRPPPEAYQDKAG